MHYPYKQPNNNWSNHSLRRFMNRMAVAFQRHFECATIDSTQSWCVHTISFLHNYLYMLTPSVVLFIAG